MGKEHSHALPRATSEKSLWLALGLTSTFLVAEVIGGLVTGSLPRTWILLKESMNILLEGVPDGIDVEAVTRAIKEVPGVRDVHEMHIWALSSNKTSLSVHVVTSPDSSYDRQTGAIRSMLADKFDIRHSTIQCELTPCGDATDATHWIEPLTGLSKRAENASN